MKKINYSELQEMLKSGRSQAECARHFKVSEAAVCKAVKRLKAAEIPASLERLSAKERAFVLNLAEGKTKTDAALSAYDCTSRDAAKTLGCRMAKDPDVAAALVDLMGQEGISRRRRIQRLRDLIESSDLAAVSRGLDMSWRLDGSYVPEQIDIKARIMSVHADIEAIRALRKEQEVRKLGVEQKLTSSDDSDIHRPK